MMAVAFRDRILKGNRKAFPSSSPAHEVYVDYCSKAIEREKVAFILTLGTGRDTHDILGYLGEGHVW